MIYMKQNIMYKPLNLWAIIREIKKIKIQPHNKIH